MIWPARHRLLFSLLLLVCASGPVSAAERPDRVALLIADGNAPARTCHLRDIEETLKTLRFDTQLTADADIEADTREFAERSANAEAAIIYACNPTAREHLPDALTASKLNLLFLLETTPAIHGTPIAKPVKTTRDNLMIIHVRIDTPQNDEIFVRTLIHKLKRPYSVPGDIISRTITSSYYRSRGGILIDIQGKIASSYILTKPPIEKILDAWSRVQYSNDRAKLEEFVARYPQTLFADLARSRLEKLPTE